MESRFEWDPVKAQTNWRKHGIDFFMAAKAFDDPSAIAEQDRVEGGELRWRTLALVEGQVVLMVAYTVREEDEDGHEVEVIRIISARRADRSERRRYHSEPR